MAGLSQAIYSFKGDRLLLEPKEQLKQRLGYSSDEADAFVLTFAQPVAAWPVYFDRSMEGLAFLERKRPQFCITDRDQLAPGEGNFCITEYDVLADG